MPILNSHGLFGNPLQNLSSVIGILSATENLHIWWCANGSGICGNHYSIYWSLALEEQFYLLFPISLLFLPARKFAWVMPILLILQLIFPRPSWSFLWAIRTDALLAGACIGWFHGHTKIRILLEPTFMKNKFAAFLFQLY